MLKTIVLPDIFVETDMMFHVSLIKRVKKYILAE